VPTDDWMNRHAEILEVLRARAARASHAQSLIDKRSEAKKYARSTSTFSPGVSSVDAMNATLLMRPTVEQVDEQWTRSLIRKGLALDLFDDPEFRKAVLMTARAGPVYVDPQKSESKLPRRTKVSTVCVPGLDAKLEAAVSKRIDGLISETGLLLAAILLIVVLR